MQLCMHHAKSEKFCSYDFQILLPLLSCVRSFAISRNDNNEPDESGKQEQQGILANCVSQISKVIDAFVKNEHLALRKEHSPMTI